MIDKINHNFDNLITKPIIDALEIEENVLNENIDDLKNQFYIDSATWGLDNWESMLGISKNNFDFQTRRENIKAKIRSKTTLTYEALKNICESYSHASVDIIVNHSDYSFVIDFTGTIGIPIAFEELDKVINEVKPAHLAHTYKFNFNTHGDISNYTHERLSSYTHDDIRNLEELRGEKIWLQNILRKRD